MLYPLSYEGGEWQVSPGCREPFTSMIHQEHR
jgi:hypothetical protein